MKEAILHYIWQSKLFYPHGLVTTDQEPVEIVNTGFRNTDAGPDFFNAKVKIGNTLWAGNVEIHVKSSDWYRHNHHTDKAYNSVVLHVVHEADAEVRSENGNRISQLILQYPPHIERNYEELMRQHAPIPCASKLHDVPSIFIRSWESTLLAERLAQKTAAIEQMLHDTHQHWEECFYVTLARNFGFGTNSDAFEALARSLPLNVLARHKDNLMQIEALLFGQAGLLPPTPPDDYARQLTDEYTFLQHKYQLSSRLDASRWKLLRLRPTNFPHVRIAQFAALVHSSSKLFYLRGRVRRAACQGFGAVVHPRHPHQHRGTLPVLLRLAPRRPRIERPRRTPAGTIAARAQRRHHPVEQLGHRLPLGLRHPGPAATENALLRPQGLHPLPHRPQGAGRPAATSKRRHIIAIQYYIYE